MQVRRYKQSILASDKSTKQYQNTDFAKLGADNVDHNIATLTGHWIFHGMGINETVTPVMNLPFQYVSKPVGT